MRKTAIYLAAVLFIGLIGCSRSPGIPLDPTSRDFLEYARLIMSRQEQIIFAHLPDIESREEFIEDFWLKRDPDPETAENEFMVEFFRRIDYANKRFKEGPPGWKTDRGRFYIYFGFPDKIDETRMHNIPEVQGSVILWVWYRYEFGVRFVDKYGYGQYTVDPYHDIYGNFFDAIERAKFGMAEEDEFGRKFVDFDVEYDSDSSELVVGVPAKAMVFREEDKILKTDFEFEFYIYSEDTGKRKKFTEKQTLEMTEEELLDADVITFRFPLSLEKGKYFLDCVLNANEVVSKSRKIFNIKV
ncbi:MAG: GWxTD domain-containing protein [Acidobacteria bacterium]|nr:GWxTD domain-containing protein [Acidobacteriota bacterium]MBU4329363.1 GWxTD domain-containing protein [Acidobacteriota bacterium]MBU4494064.1 GWxTD domain-containing protein [Acidobacteriota bacterium]MCG2815221.1 GWxTD domain-containing protein [Candidatus Aminicenantes bacterium]